MGKKKGINPCLQAAKNTTGGDNVLRDAVTIRLRGGKGTRDRGE